MVWIGDRTRSVEGAHVEYARGIRNPVGIKVGPSMTAEELNTLLDVLNPDDTPGRITLISRFGAEVIGDALPTLIESVKGRKVTWSCDPMHGNTRVTETGLKTRRFDDVQAELRTAFDVHEETGSVLGGVHFELTGEDVTECTGGPQELSEADLPRSYTTHCDPRLNYAQSLEVAFQLARRLRQHRARD